MNLSSLNIQSLRNLNQVTFFPHSRLNYLIGPNGSGKTSVIEAIYLLGLGQSFRASQLNRLIQHDMEELVVFAVLTDEKTEQFAKLGFSRDRQNKTRIKLNEEPVKSLAELAQLLPILLLYAESYALFRDSPKARRKWLDWGMFHVEPHFFPAWKRLQRILQQRNALLKQGAPDRDIMVWNLALIELSEAIHLLRAAFIAKWEPIFFPVLEALFDKQDLALQYSPGWDIALGLSASLTKNNARDRALGYTTCGPQRADIEILINGLRAQDVLSLGQQKLLVSGIILSLAILLQTVGDKSPILLIDDLPAELDTEAREKIAAFIYKLEAQIFLTAIDHATITPFLNKKSDFAMFHVEHGKIIKRD